jgi:putative membrane protein
MKNTMDNIIPKYQPQLAKRLNRIALIVSIIVILVVASLRRLHVDTSIDFSWLAAFHSTLNAITAIGLLLAYYFIKNNNILWHKRLMIANMIFSGLFLLSYIVYHLTTPETKYCHEGGIRYFYLILLATHIILAAVILPVILYTFIRAYTGQIELHKKMAKWAFPLWLYIAITGPVIYLMLRSCM